MLHILKNQQLITDIRMNKDFEEEKIFVISGINENGVREEHQIEQVDFFVGVASSKTSSESYLIDKNILSEFADIIIKNTDKVSINTIEDLDDTDVVAIDVKNRQILFSPRGDTNLKRELLVAKYPNTKKFDDVVSDYKNRLGYSEDFSGTIACTGGFKVYDYYTLYDKTIVNEQTGYVLKTNDTNSKYLGNVVFADERTESVINNKYSTIILVLKDKDGRKVVSNNSGEFFIAGEGMGPRLDKNELLDEEMTRKIGMINEQSFDKLIEAYIMPDYVIKNDIVKNVVFEDGKVIGERNGKDFETTTDNIFKKDDQLYIKDNRKTYKIVSVNPEYLKNNSIDNINQLFSKINGLENKLEDITLNHYDIQKDSIYNNETKKFEEKYLIVADGKEIPLDNKAILSLENGFVQRKNEIYYLKNSLNPEITNNVMESFKGCTIENNKYIKIDDKRYVADIIDSEHKIAFRKGTIYTIDGETTSAIGADPSKPNNVEVSYVSPKINDLNTDKLQNMDLNLYQSEKVNNWSIERHGAQYYLVGETKDGYVNNLLTHIKEDKIVESNGLKMQERVIPRASIVINREEKIVDLGFPSERTNSHSAYREPMNEVIEKHGFRTVAIDTNIKMADKLKYAEPQEAVRGLPRECFVLMADKLFLKVNNTLVNNEATLDFKNEQLNIQAAFTTVPSDTRKIKALMGNTIHVEKENGEYKLSTTNEVGETTELSIIPTSDFQNNKYAAKEENLAVAHHEDRSMSL